MQLRVSRGSEEVAPGIKPHCVTFLDCGKPQDCGSNVENNCLVFQVDEEFKTDDRWPGSQAGKAAIESRSGRQSRVSKYYQKSGEAGTRSGSSLCLTDGCWWQRLRRVWSVARSVGRLARDAFNRCVSLCSFLLREADMFCTCIV